MKKSFVLVLLIVIFILTLRGIPGNLHPNGTGRDKINPKNTPFDTSLDKGRYAQTISLVEKQTFNVDEFSEFLKPDLAWYNGHFYPAFPPGPAILSVPSYLIGRFFGLSQLFTFATSAIFSILTVLVIFKIAKKINLSTETAIFSGVVFAVCSIAFAYSVTVTAHIISAFIVALCFLISLNIKKGENNLLWFLMLWFFYSINLFIDYPNLVILFPLLIFTIYKVIDIKKADDRLKINFPMTIVYGSLTAILVFILFIAFNLHHYSKPIAFTNTYNLKALEILGVKVDYDNLSNDLFSKKAYAGRFKNLTQIEKGIHTLLTSHDRGLFFYSPIFLLSIVGFIICYRKKENYWLPILLTFLADLLIYASFDDPWGGWGFGPRYLIPSLPLLAIMVGKAFDFLVEKGLFIQLVIYLLTLYSFGISLMGALTTNAIPPSVEVAASGAADNFIVSWNYISKGRSSSFLYNLLFKGFISPIAYFYIIFTSISSYFALLVFVKTAKKRSEAEEDSAKVEKYLHREGSFTDLQVS